MKMLHVIFTYNRFFLLRNTVESFREFGPPGDLLVIDDGSDDPLVRTYLSLLQSEGVSVIVQEWKNESFHGGLYHNMNLAVEHALGGEYTHIFFLQDDVQFMWRDEHFVERVERFFAKCPDASTLTPMFFKGIIRDQMSKRAIEYPELEAWQLSPFGIIDIGIVPVKLFKDPMRRFGLSSEVANSSEWYKSGFRAYMMAQPILAWVPWPCGGLVRWRTASTHAAPSKKYFLKPFGESEVQTLKSTSLKVLPYHEDFCKPWGWRCLSPYWFTAGRRSYITLMWRSLFSSKPQLPKIVTAK